MNTPKTEAIVALIKREILADIKAGLVPANVKNFSQLHRCVDANEYGGFCDDDSPFCLNKLSEQLGEGKLVEFINGIQVEVDAWLQAGRPTLGD